MPARPPDSFQSQRNKGRRDRKSEEKKKKARMCLASLYAHVRRAWGRRKLKRKCKMKTTGHLMLN